MKDLTPSFEYAASLPGPWGDTEIHEALSFIRRVVGESNIDWEPGDEEWARALTGGTVVALVCVRIPLVITTELGFYMSGVSVVEVTAMDRNEWRVDAEYLARLFGRRLSENIDYEALSIDELWWATS